MPWARGSRNFLERIIPSIFPDLLSFMARETGLDCVQHRGIHYWADYYILEILDPDTLRPVTDISGLLIANHFSVTCVIRLRPLSRKILS